MPAFAVYAAMRLHALGGWVPGLAEATLPPRELALNAVALVPEYVKTFVFPVGLDMYHDFDALRTAAWLDEALPTPHHYLANVHFLAGRLVLAAEEQRQALDRAPVNPLYQRNLASLRRAMADRARAALSQR